MRNWHCWPASAVDYYLRLEQGRDKNPSAQVLDALARVLRLDIKATEYLHQLASPSAALWDYAGVEAPADGTPGADRSVRDAGNRGQPVP